MRSVGAAANALEAPTRAAGAEALDDAVRSVGAAANALEAPTRAAGAEALDDAMRSVGAAANALEAPTRAAGAEALDDAMRSVGAAANALEAPTRAAGAEALDDAMRSVGAAANALEAPTRAAGAEALDDAVRSVGPAGAARKSPSPGTARPPTTPAALELTEVRAEGLAGVTLTAYPGEILGIAGVDGNGQRELAEVLTGLRPFTGQYVLEGQRLAALTPAQAQRSGVAHIPEDRLARAIIADLTVEENVALGRHQQPPFAKGLRIDFEGRRARALELVTANDVRPPEPTARMGDLSGGNQQKLVVARELDRHPKVLVAVQPTRGLDLLALAAVHARLRAEAARGCAVVLISLDLDEVLALAHRVLVLFEGKVNGEFPRAQADERTLGRRMLGAAP